MTHTTLSTRAVNIHNDRNMAVADVVVIVRCDCVNLLILSNDKDVTV